MQQCRRLTSSQGASLLSRCSFDNLSAIKEIAVLYVFGRFGYLTLFPPFVPTARGAAFGANPTVLHNHSTQLSVSINTARRV